MNMSDRSGFLDKFLQVSDYELLFHAGTISALEAKLKADSEYEQYRITQDRLYVSDFDREIQSFLDQKS